MSIYRAVPVSVLLLELTMCVPWQTSWAQNAEAQENAAEKVVRLLPSAFSELPRNISADLQKRGCTVPQAYQPPTYSSSNPNNVLRGEFAQPGQQDWAVLCSRDRPVASLPPNFLLQLEPSRSRVWTSAILVYFAGSTTNVSEFAEGEDMFNMLADEKFVGGKTVITGYSYMRELRIPGQSYIVDHIQAYGEPDVHYPPIDHDGIEDPILDKASVIHYFYQGKWMKLPGAD